MRKTLPWIIISLGIFLFAKENAFSQQASNEGKELGRISLLIHDFEYTSFGEDPEGISWSSRNKLGEPQGFIVRIFPTNAEFKKIQRERIETEASLPSEYKQMLKGPGVFFRPKNFEELLEWLQKGWALDLAVKPAAINEIIIFEVPAGEYFFDYAVEFENRMGIDILFPSVRTMRENDRNLPLWGPLKVTVSNGETVEVDIRPTYKNSGEDIGFHFIERYMSDIFD